MEEVKKFYYSLQTEKFVPGKTKINYAGRIYDEKELTFKYYDIGVSIYKLEKMFSTCREAINLWINILYVITGFLPHLEALKKMTILDVLAVPSRRNPATEFNIPIKILEAWAIGIPVGGLW